MKTVAEFKKENGIETIQFYKGTKENGCQWADTSVGRVFLSPKTDTTKPCFVIVNDGLGDPNRNVPARPELAGTLWVVNANVTLAGTL
jgi:hypothetical protein